MCCRSVILQKQADKQIKPMDKEIRFVVTKSRRLEEGELDECGQIYKLPVIR